MININQADMLPQAFARIRGSDKYSNIFGVSQFTQLTRGVLITSRINGLPYSDENCNYGVFGFHIHEGKSCTGNSEDAFADTKAHYNPDNCPHPYHRGDLPPLFGNKGYAYMSLLTDRFTLSEIIGKTIVIHLHPDDFTTQPSGNSGEKIACGVIKLI